MASTIKDMVGKHGLKNSKGGNLITKDNYKTPTTGFNRNLRARHEQQKAIKRKMK